MAARDRPDDLRARRDGIVNRLCTATAGCTNCVGRPPPVAALAAAGLDEPPPLPRCPDLGHTRCCIVAGSASRHTSQSICLDHVLHQWAVQWIHNADHSEEDSFCCYCDESCNGDFLEGSLVWYCMC